MTLIVTPSPLQTLFPICTSPLSANNVTAGEPAWNIVVLAVLLAEHRETPRT
jgi:hypothetical protein